MANFNTPKKALINAHNTGNKSAISKKDLEDAGLVGYFDEYEGRFDALHKICGDILTASQIQGKTDKEFQALERKAMAAWTAVLEMAQPNAKTVTIKARRIDLRLILGDIKKAMVIDGVSVYGKTGKKAFRRMIERYLGCLMAAQYVLTDEETETVKSYQKALKTAENMNTAIKDKTDVKDRYVGDINKIKKVKGAESTVEILEKFVEDLDKEISKAQTKLDNAQEIIDEKKTAYEEIQKKVAKAEITDEQVKAKEVA